MSKINRIVVDLTPVLPGGENGGAKIMTMELIRDLAVMEPQCEFVLLTSDKSHDELAALNAPNVRRKLTRVTSRAESGAISLGKRLLARFPMGVRVRLAALYFKLIRQRRRSAGPMELLEADLLFCPFTAPYYHHSTIPTVSVVYDLQYRSYPQFFTSEELYHREQTLQDACRLADEIVCISEYVRESVLKHASVDPARVHTIHIQLPQRLPMVEPEISASLLAKLSLEANAFLLYPANFWPHKNHEMLLTAFGMYRARNPASGLKLVCTGTPGSRRDYIIEAASRMGLGPWVIFSGYLRNEEFAALMKECFAVIYPSLYEGFGMPIVEAMVARKPVLCSRVASIPEIAADAAIYFDPKRPTEIVSAIEDIVSNPGLVAELIDKGVARAQQFFNPMRMASQYWSVFERATDNNRCEESLSGVFHDRWCSELINISYGPNPGSRELHITLRAPAWLPRQVEVQDHCSGQSLKLKKGQFIHMTRTLGSGGGRIRFDLSPAFQPAYLGMGEDQRMVTCKIECCQIVNNSGETRNLLQAETHIEV